jgi:caffeoyl-CoA O-methyltransferase
MDAIVNREIEAYLMSLRKGPNFGGRDSVSEEMEQLAKKRGVPIVGPEVGKLLFILARVSGARNVLELGSGFGYSAYWFAQGLKEEGHVRCTDYSSEFGNLAHEFFRKAGIEDKLIFEVGNALDILKTIDGSYDIIFCDIDKQDYPRALDMALPLLAHGGLFITDNVLWYGRVASVSGKDSLASAVDTFNKKLLERDDMETVILPLRDGVSVSVKVG